MSVGVSCKRKSCRHFEEAHDPETGKCRASWGPAHDRKHCDCPALLLPADAEAQRAFARQFQAQLSHTVEDRILNQQTRFVRRLRQSLYDGWKPGQPFKPRSGVVLGERRSDTKAS